MMKMSGYAQCDGLGLADPVARHQVSPKELALTAGLAGQRSHRDLGLRRRRGRPQARELRLVLALRSQFVSLRTASQDRSYSSSASLRLRPASAALHVDVHVNAISCRCSHLSHSAAPGADTHWSAIRASSGDSISAAAKRWSHGCLDLPAFLRAREALHAIKEGLDDAVPPGQFLPHGPLSRTRGR